MAKYQVFTQAGGQRTVRWYGGASSSNDDWYGGSSDSGNGWYGDGDEVVINGGSYNESVQGDHFNINGNVVENIGGDFVQGSTWEVNVGGDFSGGNGSNWDWDTEDTPTNLSEQDLDMFTVTVDSSESGTIELGNGFELVPSDCGSGYDLYMYGNRILIDVTQEQACQHVGLS